MVSLKTCSPYQSGTRVSSPYVSPQGKVINSWAEYHGSAEREINGPSDVRTVYWYQQADDLATFYTLEPLPVWRKLRK